MAVQKTDTQSLHTKPENMEKDTIKESSAPEETEKTVLVSSGAEETQEEKQVLKGGSYWTENGKEILVEEQGGEQGENKSEVETALGVEEVEESQKSRFREIEAGMTVKVYQKIKEKTAKGVDREREQIFEGIILARKHGTQAGATITVRKISHGVWVEKIFPLQLPTLTRIEVVKQLRRKKRSKLYFLRNYKKRLKEIKMVSS